MMMIKSLFGSGKKVNEARVPAAYKRSVKWIPKIGDIFPDFEASTTHGTIRFFDWAEGHWSFLFSHPAAFTPVCTTEMVSLAKAKDDFAARQVKLLGFTASSLDDQNDWHDDMLAQFGIDIDFPTINDEDAALAQTFGMIHEKESRSWPIRKSFILDPQMRIRMIFEYPVYVGRSTEEVLRAIDALKAVDKFDVAIPADWHPGDHYLCSEKHDATDDEELYGDRLHRLTPYLALIRPRK